MSELNKKIESERQASILRAEELISKGVYLCDPNRFDIRGSLICGKNVEIDVNVIIEGNVKLGDDVTIGPNCILKDTAINSGTKIKANSIIERADIGKFCLVGPYARVRPGTTLRDNVSNEKNSLSFFCLFYIEFNRIFFLSFGRSKKKSYWSHCKCGD